MTQEKKKECDCINCQDGFTCCKDIPPPLKTAKYICENCGCPVTKECSLCDYCNTRTKASTCIREDLHDSKDCIIPKLDEVKIYDGVDRRQKFVQLSDYNKLKEENERIINNRELKYLELAKEFSKLQQQLTAYQSLAKYISEEMPTIKKLIEKKHPNISLEFLKDKEELR